MDPTEVRTGGIWLSLCPLLGPMASRARVPDVWDVPHHWPAAVRRRHDDHRQRRAARLRPISELEFLLRPSRPLL